MLPFLFAVQFAGKLFLENKMPKGQRRTLEQQLEDLKQKQAEIEARIKAKSALSADHKAVKAIKQFRFGHFLFTFFQCVLFCDVEILNRSER